MKSIIKFFFIVVFVFSGIFTHRYLASLIKNNHYETETVFPTSISDSFSGDIFVFRKEEPIMFEQTQSKNNKFIDYLVEDGEKVFAGQVVATVYDSEEDIKSMYDLANIKEELELLSEIKVLKNKRSVSSEILYGQIVSNFGCFIDSSNKRIIDNLKKEKQELFLSLLKKNMIHNKVFNLDKKIESLEKQREFYNNIKYNFQTIVSHVSGYFNSQIDGFEKNILDTNEEETLLTDNFLDYDSCRSIIKSSPKKTNNNCFIGKIVSDFDWYIILNTNKKNTENLRLNSLVEIDYDISSFKKIPAVVLNVDESDDNKDSAVILKSNYISREILNLRKKRVTVFTKSFHGLAVNMKAIRFFNGEKGVFVKDDKEIKFKKLDIIFESEQKIISKLRPLESDYLQAFDEVILSGHGLFDGKIVDY